VFDHVWNYKEIAAFGNIEVSMAIPYSGNHPGRLAVFVILGVVVLLVMGIPELQSALVQKLPWLSPIVVWLRSFRNPH
jgi:hypothetical protein